MKDISLKKCQNRILYFDYLRILATLAVIVLHVAAQNWYTVNITSLEWHIFNIIDSAVRWCVPIFVMISGAIFLNNDKLFDIKFFYTHNIFRIVTAFVFWSAIYAGEKKIFGGEIKDVVRAFIEGEYHMWFLYMIIGLYIVTPIVRKITLSKTTTEYFLIIGIIFTFLIPRSINLLKCINFSHSITLINAIDTAFAKMHFNFAMGYLFYYILGFYLFKYEISATWRRTSYIGGIVGYIITVFLTNWYSNKTGIASEVFYSNFSINVLLMSLCIFLCAKYILSKINLTGKGLQILLKLSKYSFGMYLAHVLVIKNLSYQFNLDTLTFNPVISIIMIVLNVVIVSCIISAILNHIPVLKKYIV